MNLNEVEAREKMSIIVARFNEINRAENSATNSKAEIMNRWRGVAVATLEKGTMLDTISDGKKINIFCMGWVWYDEKFAQPGALHGIAQIAAGDCMEMLGFYREALFFYKQARQERCGDIWCDERIIYYMEDAMMRLAVNYRKSSKKIEELDNLVSEQVINVLNRTEKETMASIKKSDRSLYDNVTAQIKSSLKKGYDSITQMGFSEKEKQDLFQPVHKAIFPYLVADRERFIYHKKREYSCQTDYLSFIDEIRKTINDAIPLVQRDGENFAPLMPELTMLRDQKVIKGSKTSLSEKKSFNYDSLPKKYVGDRLEPVSVAQLPKGAKVCIFDKSMTSFALDIIWPGGNAFVDNQKRSTQPDFMVVCEGTASRDFFLIKGARPVNIETANMLVEADIMNVGNLGTKGNNNKVEYLKGATLYSLDDFSEITWKGGCMGIGDIVEYVAYSPPLFMLFTVKIVSAGEGQPCFFVRLD